MKKTSKKISGIIYDPILKESFTGTINIEGEKIIGIKKEALKTNSVILPGFIDAHVHIESSMLTPQNFSDAAIKHGTIALVADPHELANVGGTKAIEYFIKNSENAKIKTFFGAPSCVPASPFDDCYQPLDSVKVGLLLKRKEIHFLSEMMNFPGVVSGAPEVVKKIQEAYETGKPVDGHAPGLYGETLRKYVEAGISTDHECFTLEEALEKIKIGMKILIREGSAAKNFETLHSLIKTHPDKCMFCTDDCHPDDLIAGHINNMVFRSLKKGYDIFDILQASSVNPVKHYKLNVGLLQVGDPADFIVVNNLKELKVKKVFINGRNPLEFRSQMDQSGKPQTDYYVFPKKFNAHKILIKKETDKLRVIDIIPGELITKTSIISLNQQEEYIDSSIERDILKIVIINRYKEEEIFAALIRGFGLKTGAIASSVAHDSHHILAIGVDDYSIGEAIKFVIKNQGGISVYHNDRVVGLKLPIYGLISNENAKKVAKQYKKLLALAQSNGCKNVSPFMTLSFMALTVIPELKISPKGLFDGIKFDFTPLFV